MNYQIEEDLANKHSAIVTLENGRRVLQSDSITINTHNSAGQSFGAFNNSGINLIHVGTCNDGVGKSCSGGRLIVKNPNSDNPFSENVLIGNFALFGATGGELYVEGQAGDRFGVRNSGAVSVVEGVGDFACEYMTNGSVVNLGSYGKGFGNGMSGGTAYQYDPSHTLAERCSQDSVMTFRINEESSLADGQEVALKIHLKQHLQHTGSKLAQQLLENWDEARNDFYFVMPRALFNYQESEAIEARMSKKEIVEELARDISLQYLRKVTEAYRQYGMSQSPMFDGKIPNFGESDSELSFEFMVVSGILRRALEAAQKASDSNHDFVARKLIATQDKRILDIVVKDIRQALSIYSESALASLLADKRLGDYKNSLKQREVWDMHARGTSVWIALRDRLNQQELSKSTPLTQALAMHFAGVMAEAFTADAA